MGDGFGRYYCDLGLFSITHAGTNMIMNATYLNKWITQGIGLFLTILICQGIREGLPLNNKKDFMNKMNKIMVMTPGESVYWEVVEILCSD